MGNGSDERNEVPVNLELLVSLRQLVVIHIMLFFEGLPLRNYEEATGNLLAYTLQDLDKGFTAFTSIHCFLS